MNKTADPLSLIPAHSFKAGNTGKFAPKMDEAERCAVLALVKSGVKRELVAAAFSIDRRTVGHICNPHGLRYKEVRAKHVAMGHEEFVRHYVTEEVALRVAKVSGPGEKPKAAGPKVPSPRANRMAGEHKVKPEQCQYEHKIEIRYINDAELSENVGWHYVDLDSDPNTLLHNGEKSLMTSQACYEAVLENIMDD